METYEEILGLATRAIRLVSCFIHLRFTEQFKYNNKIILDDKLILTTHAFFFFMLTWHTVCRRGR